MSRDVALVALALTMLPITATACRRRSEPREPPPRRVIRLITGSPGAGYYPLGQSLARVYRTVFPELDVITSGSPGSVRNVEAIQRGEADVGFAFADVAYLAYVGALDSAPFDRLRGIAVLQINPIHLVVGAGSPILDIPGLRAKRVGFGPVGSGTAATAELVLRAYGIAPTSVRASFLPVAEAAAAMGARRLDAMFVNASYPAGAVTQAIQAGARLLPIAGAPVEGLRHTYPFFRLVSIPAGTYPHHPVAVHTIGVDNVLICRDDLSDDIVYRLTRGFFDALSELSSEQESLRQIRLADVAATPIPLHEGAAHYYRQRELSR